MDRGEELESLTPLTTICEKSRQVVLGAKLPEAGLLSPRCCQRPAERGFGGGNIAGPQVPQETPSRRWISATLENRLLKKSMIGDGENDE